MTQDQSVIKNALSIALGVICAAVVLVGTYVAFESCPQAASPAAQVMTDSTSIRQQTVTDH